jgi:hypothetical protein
MLFILLFNPNLKALFMKKSILSFFFVFPVVFTAFGQLQTQDAVSYSPVIQIDSSDSYLIGTLIDKSNKTKYNFGLSYGRGMASWTNVLIYNSKRNETKKIFTTSPVLISPVINNYIPVNYTGLQEFRSSTLLKNFILFFVKGDDYNKNGVINDEDPFYLFISSKSGNNLTQITPKDMNVISWTLSKDNKTILVKLQKDKNADNKFFGDDEVIYQIDLNDDISKIKTFPINI